MYLIFCNFFSLLHLTLLASHSHLSLVLSLVPQTTDQFSHSHRSVHWSRSAATDYCSFAYDYLNIFSLSTLTLINSISSLESSAQYSKPPPPNPATYHHHHYKIAIHNKTTTNSKENQLTHTRIHNRDIERERSDWDQLWRKSVVVGVLEAA